MSEVLAILKAVAFAAEAFLRTSDWQASLAEVLARLGHAARASRIYIFENHANDAGELCLSQRAEWVAAGINPEINNPLLQNLPYDRAGLRRWRDLLGAGEAIFGAITDFPASERVVLDPQAIRSLIVVPIIVEEQWWGFIGFDDCFEERDWNGPERDALRAAADIIGAAIQRTAATTQLRSTRDQLQMILDHAPLVIWGKDSQGRYTLWSRQGERAFGLNRDQVLGKTDAAIFPREVAQIHEATDRLVLERNQPMTFEGSAPAGGYIHNHHIAKYPVYNEAGRPMAVYGFAVDVTEREQLYTILERRLAEMTTIQRVAQVISSAVGLETIFRTVVETIGEAFGYRMVSVYLREGEGLTLQAHIGYDEVISFIHLNQGVSGRVARSGKAVFVRDAANDPDFAYAVPGVCQAIIVPLCYAGDEVMGTLAVESTGEPELTDDDLMILRLLADQVSVAVMNARLFAGLRSSEQRYRTLVETAGSVIVYLAADFSIIELNHEAERLFGVAREDVQGKNYLELFVPPEEHAAIIVGAHHVLAGPPSQGLENTVCTPQGHRMMLWNVTRVPDGEAQAAGFLAIGQDITARKQAEEEHREFERRLMETQKLESLGVLAGGIAHDFNNLLMAIIGNIGLAQLELPHAAPAHEYLAQSELAAQRAADLTRQILAYAGRGRISLQPVDINMVLEETSALLHASVSRHITLTSSLTPGLPPVTADITQLRQVAMNLLINASEAIGDRPGTIHIQTATRYTTRADLAISQMGNWLSPGYYVTLMVDDDGCGMDEQTMARMFEPFYTTKFPGRGLGMAMVQGIVRSHQGAIQVVSTPGRGTRITVLLPANQAPAPAPSTASPTDADNLPHKGCILVVDDDEAVRRVAIQMLRSMGFDTLAAADGQEGLEICYTASNQIDCILLDLTMPRMDGAALLHFIRAVGPDVPVVVMSGYSEAEVARRFATLRPEAVLHKPFTHEALHAALVRALEQKNRGTEEQ